MAQNRKSSKRGSREMEQGRDVCTIRKILDGGISSKEEEPLSQLPVVCWQFSSPFGL